MIKHNQDGAVSGLGVSMALTLFLLFCTLIFGLWAFSSRQNYKNHADVKIAAATEAATQKESAIKDAQFADAIKQPLKTYNGPEAYGSVVLNVPKNWSGYIDDSGNGASFLNAYFAPNFVPSLNTPASVYALRLVIENQTFDQELQSFTGQQQNGQVTVSAYALPKVPKAVGVKVVGQISDKINVTMVVLPLRSQTIKLWTEGGQYTDDFNNNILPNFSFSP